MANRNERVSGIDFSYHNPNSASSLSKAVRRGRLNLVKKLISRGKNPDVPDNRGWTSLHEASVDESNEKILSFLLQRGAYVDHKTVDGETPLFLACSRGNCVGVAILLKAGADINSRNNEALTPLHAACFSSSNIGVVKQLIGAGASLDAEDVEGRTALFTAIDEKNLEAVKLLLKLTPVRFDRKDEQNILLFAIARGNTEIFKVVVNSSEEAIAAARDFATESEGWTLLMEAAQGRQPATVEFLLGLGAGVERADRRGVTALHVAAHSLDPRSFPLILAKTPLSTLRARCTFKNRMFAPASLPCLLMDSDNFAGLSKLLEGGYPQEVLTCQVQQQNRILSPAGSLLFRCSRLHHRRKLDFLNLLIEKKVPLDVPYGEPGEYMTCLEALLKWHRGHHYLVSPCLCEEKLRAMLARAAGLTPTDPMVILPLILDSLFVPAARLLLSKPTVVNIDPQKLADKFVERLMDPRYRFSDEGDETQFIQFLAVVVTNYGRLRELGSCTMGFRTNRQRLLELWEVAAVQERKVPSLKRLCRAAARLSFQPECLSHLPLPHVVIDYLHYCDLDQEML